MKLLNSVSTAALAGAAFALAVAGSEASAAAFLVSDDAATPGPDTQTLTFAGFDPAAGTLVGVEFSLVGTKRAGASVQGFFFGGEGIGTSATAQVTGTFSVLLSAGPTLFQDDIQSEEATCLGPDDCGPTPLLLSAPVSIAASPSTVTLTDPALLAALTGPALDFGIDVEALTELTLCNAVPDFDAACEGDGVSTWEGEITVRFITRPEPEDTPVPAPAALGLLGGALLGLGALRRRPA